MRLRASASIAALWSTPTARTARGASSSSIRPVPVPRSSRLRNGFSPIIAIERRLDPLLRSMQRADPVPVGGLLGEIGGGLPAPRLARGLEPGPVGGQSRVGRIEPADKVAGEGAALVGEAEERPGPLALALGEARLDQELQMARDARLRLAEDRDQLADRELRLVEQAEDPQPRLLARRLETGEEGGKGQAMQGRALSRHKHIFMSKPFWTQGAASPIVEADAKTSSPRNSGPERAVTGTARSGQPPSIALSASGARIRTRR